MFQVAPKIPKSTKVLVWGPSGAGKTYFALNSPNPAVIDTEHGTDLYGGQFTFLVAHAQTPGDVLKGIEEASKQPHVQTLVIDSMSVVLATSRAAQQKIAGKSELSFRQHGAVNDKQKQIYMALMALKQHVIVTARESDLYEVTNNAPKVVGTKADIDKHAQWMFDFVLRFRKDGSIEIVKARGGYLKTGDVIPRTTFSELFGPLLSGNVGVEAEPLEETIDRAVDEIQTEAAEEITADSKMVMIQMLVRNGTFPNQDAAIQAAVQLKNSGMNYEDDPAAFKTALEALASS